MSSGDSVDNYDISRKGLIVLSSVLFLFIAFLLFEYYLINRRRKNPQIIVAELPYNSTIPLLFNQIDCVICLDHFENGQVLHHVSCGYVFHRNCIFTYLLKKMRFTLSVGWWFQFSHFSPIFILCIVIY